MQRHSNQEARETPVRQESEYLSNFYPGGVLLVQNGKVVYSSVKGTEFLRKYFPDTPPVHLDPKKILFWNTSGLAEPVDQPELREGWLDTSRGKIPFLASFQSFPGEENYIIEFSEKPRDLFPELLPIEALPVGLWVLKILPGEKKQYRSLLTNRYLRNLSGRGEDEFRRIDPSTLLSSSSVSDVFDPDCTPVEANLFVRDGGTIPVRVDSLRGGNGESLILAFTDLSDLKAGEGELKAMHDVLMETVEQLMEANHGLSQSYEKLEVLSSTDELTGLNNRRKFQEFLAFEWVRAVRARNYLSILLIDVDYFKQYNDTYGHREGDQCLKLVADGLSRSVRRSTDMLARYGGEEFIVVMPDTPPEGVPVLAERLRAAVEDMQIAHESSMVGNVVTVSMGGASLIPSGTLNDHELIQLADRALYRAKELGRNRLHMLTDAGEE